MLRCSAMVLAVAVVIGSPPVGSGQQKQLPFSFVIRAAEEEIKPGSDVVVEITITNNSDRAIGMESMDISPYVAIVRAANGVLAPETEMGRSLKQKQRERISPNWVGSRFGVRLQPGEAVHEKCVVSERYDMTAPGRYSIQLERLWGRAGVPSNTVMVAVVP